MSRKKQWDLDTLLSVAGFTFEMIRLAVGALQKRHGNIEHLRRLLNDQALTDMVFDLIMTDTEAKTDVPPGHYRVLRHPKKPMLSPMDFYDDVCCIDPVFAVFQSYERLPCCEFVDPCAFFRIYYLRRLENPMPLQQVCEQSIKDGYRPATIEESISFLEAIPLREPMMVLGTFVQTPEGRVSPEFYLDFDGDLCVRSMDIDKDSKIQGQILLVRLTPKERKKSLLI